MHRFFSAISVLLAVTSASFGQIVVDSIDDDSGPGDCELREAIINANSNDQSGSTDCAGGSGFDTIALTGLSGTIELGSTLPAIVDSLKILGPEAGVLTIDANRTGRVFWVGSGYYLYISDVTITGGLETIGGGFYNLGSLTIVACEVTDNIADQGSGIYNNGGGAPGPLHGELNIINSLISNNHDPEETFGNGGGLNTSAGPVTIRGSTFSGNVSDSGGGILSWDRLVIENSTITGNHGENGGGGIALTLVAHNDWALYMSHSTVTKNTTGSVGGGLSIGYNPGSDTTRVSLYSSIIADNSQDIYGPVFESRGYNILGRNSLTSGLLDGVNGDQVGTNASPLDPGLFFLASYGALTPVHVPKAGSPALDKGSCSSDAETEDQRGVSRPQDLDDGTYANADDGCDVGAVENRAIDLESEERFVGKVLLEGPYDGSLGMDTTLNASLPLGQPFSDAIFDGTPLDYDGSESVGEMPTDVVDWLLVSLRTGPGIETTVEGSTRPALLKSNGDIVGLDEDTLSFGDFPRMPYYVVVRHRNHLGVMSSSAIAGMMNGLGVWDFTESTLIYTTGPVPSKEVDTDVYAMFAGNGSPDGFITAPDFNAWFSGTTAGLTGYQPADYDLDGNVTASDFNFWNANTTSGAASQVPD